MNYLVIGGSTGIGLALVEKLIADGHDVIAVSRHRGELPLEAKFIELDILGDVAVLKDHLPETIHGLAYCPGTINLKPFSRLTADDFRKDYEVNVIGAVKVIQQVLPQLKASKQASILMFSTVAAKAGMGFHASIAAAKSAIEGLTVSLAAEFAASNIRVNTLAPSLTDTPLAASLLATPERREASEKRHPLGRVGTAEELAEAAYFLLSEKSSWITGQVIGIDGGMSTLKSF
ncbi:SDR family oxidoreductase [Pedobacter aquae]|uniref:SDR family oxidoreductase n=1 Tax=Pedobacter aquae TaxID=2605747 RepID=A0A5C0VJ81_9SPHI|nr:SDR family oxidoreductase [Pedobacter aquae]QEK52129.1 SDR family oxidoreductase [Pedobacter aquae]